MEKGEEKREQKRNETILKTKYEKRYEAVLRTKRFDPRLDDNKQRASIIVEHDEKVNKKREVQENNEHGNRIHSKRRKLT